MIALRPKTGEIVWHYQFTPNDVYDYDAVWELILAELPINGVKRKVVMQLNRNGFLYVLDRANGELLAANPYEKVNWASHIDKETGRPVETEIAKKLRSGEQIEMWPSTRGGKNWPHAAFNPETGLLYANTIHEGRLYRWLPPEPYQAGQRYMFVENLNMPSNGQPIGHVDAIDPLTGKQRWRVPLYDHQYWAAMLATGSGLLFTGKETGEFIALDADNGKTLWQFQTGSGINAMPITYTHNGQQYVTVLSGVGGLYLEPCQERAQGTWCRADRYGLSHSCRTEAPAAARGLSRLRARPPRSNRGCGGVRSRSVSLPAPRSSRATVRRVTAITCAIPKVRSTCANFRPSSTSASSTRSRTARARCRRGAICSSPTTSNRCGRTSWPANRASGSATLFLISIYSDRDRLSPSSASPRPTRRLSLRQPVRRPLRNCNQICRSYVSTDGIAVFRST